MRTVEQVREDIPILKKIVYFDSASVCPPPLPVIQSMVDYYKDCPFNYHVSRFKATQEAARRGDTAREQAARFMNAESSSQVIFTKNTTEALNLVARGLKFDRGDEVILTNIEHQSNIIPWQKLAKQTGLKIKVVKANDEGIVEPSNIEENLSTRTRVVTVIHVSNIFGTIQRVVDIGKVVRNYENISYLVDAAQSAGRTRVDVNEIDADFVTFCGRKALMGPQGTGLLYGTNDALKTLNPLELGSRAANVVSEQEFSSMEAPFKFEAGIVNTSGLIGLGRAIKYIEEIGLTRILERIKQLTKIMIENLEELPNIELYGDRSVDNQAGIVPFNVKGYSPHEVAVSVDTSNMIALASGANGSYLVMKQLGVEGIVRASVHYFNTEDEIQTLIRSLRKLKR